MPDVSIVVDTESHSGSPHLPLLLNQAVDLIGEPDVCIAMAPTGAYDFERLWMLGSTRGYLNFDFKVGTMRESHDLENVGGICPDPSSIMRWLLNRIDDPLTGQLKLSD
jgi:hypothetical protein